jgi:O-antigen ligase
MPTVRLFFAYILVLVASLVLGGGTRPGFLSDVAIQLLAIPLLLMALLRLAQRPSLRGARWALWLCFAVVLVPVAQLVPLPPETWTLLPNREAAAEAFRLLGRDLPWMPLSLSPRATWLSALSLLPPVAIFLATLLLGHRERRAASLVLVIVGVVSVFLGLAQVSEGPASSLRFFSITNSSEAVGFFANRNHFAAGLYGCTLFAAAWVVEAAAPPPPGQARLDTRWVLAVMAGFTALVILVAGQAIARSRAGLGLTIVALLGAVALAFRDRRNTSGVTPTRLLFAATALAMMFAAQFMLYRVLERFAEDPLKDARVTLAGVTAEAAQLYMPFGSGMGTFVPVFAMQQRPEDAVLDAYANRAHNDFLELWLETGVAGLVLMVLFALWLIRNVLKVWRGRGDAAAGTEIDLTMARAGTLVIALIVAHSFVDYPLRTGAMMAILAFACGLLVAPLAAPAAALKRKAARQEQARRGGSPPQQAPPRPLPAPRPADAPISQHQTERWGHDIEWPEEWR